MQCIYRQGNAECMISNLHEWKGPPGMGLMKAKWTCRLDCMSSCMAIEMIFQKCTITFKSSKMPCPKLKCNLMSNGWKACCIRKKCRASQKFIWALENNEIWARSVGCKTCTCEFSKIGQCSSPFSSMMQAPNDKIFNMKVVYLFKAINLVINLTSFGFGMRELCILEVDKNCLFNDDVPKWPIMFPLGTCPCKLNLTFLKE